LRTELFTFEVDDDSADVPTNLAKAGAIVAGRRLFDIVEGWGDSHPMGAPVVVVTHRTPEDAVLDGPHGATPQE